MHPELFEVPFLHVTVKSSGTLMVVGFLLAVGLMRRMMRKAGQNPECITNAALYALIAGIVGSKLFYVVHHFDPAVGVFSLFFSGSGFEFSAVYWELSVFCLFTYECRNCRCGCILTYWPWVNAGAGVRTAGLFYERLLLRKTRRCALGRAFSVCESSILRTGVSR
jgi:hypothetical protein